nr:hypothetical protein [Candidatus Sigynarchaeota archaeon]
TNDIDLLDVDSGSNTIVGGHCGSCSTSLAGTGEIIVGPVRLANHGACVLFPGKPGDVIIANLVGRSNTYRACALKGTAMEAGLVFPGNPVKIKLTGIPAKNFLELVSNEAFGHHWIVGYGMRHFDAVLMLFKLLGIPLHEYAGMIHE